jgi:DHA1 family tetracycline resistance protein-like MFS transporter
MTSPRVQNALLIATACLLGLLATTGASLPYPILPPLFVAEASNSLNNFLGLPPKLLFGVALMINPIGLLVGTAFIGPLADRFGRRRILLITSVGAACGHAATATALAMQSYPLFLLARLVTGLLGGQSSVVRAMLADRLEGSARNHALSWLNGALHLGWLVGPALAGFTLGWGITVPFYVAAGALLLGAVLVSAALAPEKLAATGSWWTVASERHAFKLLRYPELRTLFIVQLAYTCGVTAFYEFYPLWLVETGGYDARGIAVVNIALCALMTFSAAFAGRASRFDPLRRASWFACAAACAVASLGLGNLWIGIAGIVLFGIPNAFYNAVVQGWVAERFSGYGQGPVMGLLGTTFCLANIVMALAGAVLTLFDTRLVLLVGAGLSAWAGRRMLGWSRLNAQPAAQVAAE